MRAVVQRVLCASVSVKSELVAEIERGLVALVGVSRRDSEKDAGWIADKLVGLRLFDDDQGRLNLSVLQVSGHLLLVPNFTVCGDAQKGRRPSFDSAAAFEAGEKLFEALADRCRSLGVRVECGQYGAEMQVSLLNDGPVTIIIESPP